jgi:hypothetical protein
MKFRENWRKKFEEERWKKIEDRNLRSFSSTKEKGKVMKTKEKLCQKRLFRDLLYGIVHLCIVLPGTVCIVYLYRILQYSD